jgi:hypothetical protein
VTLREALPFFVLMASVAAICGGVIVAIAVREFENWCQRIALLAAATVLVTMGGMLAIDVGQKSGWLS